jgi:hypothetical protein
MPRQLLQLKGDPSIRRFVFSQTRTESLFDRRYGELVDRVEELFLFYGVFHVQIHMSTNQVTVWLLDDPFNYRVLAGEEIFNPPMARREANLSYPGTAKIPAKQVRTLLERFRDLRFGDDTVYLRSGSINVMNGCLGLNFSCDGTHYIDHKEFLDSPLYEV